MFFDSFPSTLFEVSNNNFTVVADFLRAVKVDPEIKTNALFFYEYEAQDGETPEIISHKFYKTTEYHWVIMLINEKFDFYRDFPQTDADIIKMAAEKYTNINGIHHYEDINGNWVDVYAAVKTPITNIEYERQLNDLKRTIKVLKSDVLSEFVQQYKSLIV